VRAKGIEELFSTFYYYTHRGYLRSISLSFYNIHDPSSSLTWASFDSFDLVFSFLFLLLLLLLLPSPTSFGSLSVSNQLAAVQQLHETYVSELNNWWVMTWSPAAPNSSNASSCDLCTVLQPVLGNDCEQRYLWWIDFFISDARRKWNSLCTPHLPSLG